MLWGEEMDSPRGRIYLMKAALEGRTPITPSFVQHFDACLGCMACVTACPSGVQYGPLIERTRAQIERHYERSWADRLFRAGVFSLVPYPNRMRVVLAPLVVLGAAVRAFGRSRLVEGVAGARPRAAGACAARDVGVADRPHRRADAGRRRAASPGRPADRLRAAARLPEGQCRDGLCAVRGRVRRHRAAATGVLRRAGPARRAARGGARLRTPVDRGVRNERRRPDRRQRGRLRIVDEGIRRAARRRSRVGLARARVLGAGSRCLGSVGGARRAQSAAASDSGHGRVSRCLSSRARAGRSIAAARRAADDSRAGHRQPGRAGGLLRQRWHLQPGAAGDGRRARGAKSRPHCCPAARFRGDRQPRLHDPDRLVGRSPGARVAGPASDRAAGRLHQG